MFLYSMLLGDTGIIKIGYTNDVHRRATEHGRKFDCRKQVKVLSAIAFNSKATVENLETQLIEKIIAAGLKMVVDEQGGVTERFYINPEVTTVEVTARKKSYKIVVG